MFGSRNNDTSSSTSVTCSIFLGVDGMAPEKKRVCIGVLELAPVAFISEANLSLECTEIFWNTTAGLYSIRPVARQADCIFWELILWRLAYCIREMKSVLSIL